MPLVISKKAKCVAFVESEEILGEILGHSNFNGEDWAVGDRIVFEDGSGAFIEQHPGDRFHVWSEPAPLNLRDIVIEASRYDQRIAQAEEIPSWRALFEKLSMRPQRQSFWARLFAQK
jgi:hypothetical protein